MTGDNLTNGMSGTYSRRSLIIGELGGMTTGQGFSATRARAGGVERACDAFANNELRGSLSHYLSQWADGTAERYRQHAGRRIR